MDNLIFYAWICVLSVASTWVYWTIGSITGKALKSLRESTTKLARHKDDDSTYGAQEGRWGE